MTKCSAGSVRNQDCARPSRELPVTEPQHTRVRLTMMEDDATTAPNPSSCIQAVQLA